MTPRSIALANMSGAPVPSTNTPLAVPTGPPPSGLLVDELRQCAGEGVGLPDGILGEGFQGFPVVEPLDGGDGLGDGVLLDIEGQCGDPLDEAAVAGSSEGGCKWFEESLPDRPDECSLPHGASPVGSLMG